MSGTDAKFSGATIAANVFTAILAAEQNAFISGVELNAQNVNVYSYLNQVETGETPNHAEAIIGSGNGISASIVGMEVNTANAISNAKANAHITGAAVTAKNAVNVEAKGQSIALANSSRNIKWAWEIINNAIKERLNTFVFIS